MLIFNWQYITSARFWKVLYSYINERSIYGLLFKGIVKWAEPGKCDILLVSRILWHKRITRSLKVWTPSFIFDTHQRLFAIIAPYKFTQCHSHEACLFSSKNLWRSVLEANKKQVPLKSYSLKIRIDSVNQILKNKEKVT